MILGGCQDIKKKHPDFPKWGWWEEKETPTSQPTSAPASSQKVDQTTKATRPIGPTDTPEDSPLPPASEVSAEKQPTGPTPVEPTPLPEQPNHRSEVWKHVSKLRNLEEYPPDEKNKMIAYVEENLQEWYKPMDVTPPDMSKSDWVHVMVWDFMPPVDFQKAAANWKKIAENENVKFPEVLTRRKLMKFVREMLDRIPKK